MRRKASGLIQKHIILFSVALFLVSAPLLWLLLDIPLRAVNLDSQYTIAVQNIASAAFCLAAMQLLLDKAFDFKNRHFFKSLFTFGLVGLIGSAGALFFSYSPPDRTPTATVLAGYLLMNLSIAVYEEILFRGILFNTMRRAWADRPNALWRAILVSSAIFGLKHLTNLLEHPQQIVMTLAQVVFAGMAGVYLAAVYYKSGNIWVVICIHFIEDIAVTIWEAFSTTAAAEAAADIPVKQALPMVLMQIPYVVVAWLMLRGDRRTEPDK